MTAGTNTPWPIPGLDAHSHARAVLLPALPPDGRASHAYLFHGPGGTGKREIARAFAAALLADGSSDVDSAAARVARGTHPDLVWVVPSGAAEMLVSDIEEPVVSGASRTPFESTRRVFVIERADAMNDQAANRLLKTLEEPASFVHLILITDRPDEVLPTVSSRCLAVRFDPLPSEKIAERLARHGIAPDQARACARLSLGNADRALGLALGEGPELRAGAESLARAALAGDVSAGPWRELLERAKRHGEQARAELKTALEAESQFLPDRDRRRHERDGEDRVKRAARRAQTEALDHGLQLTGLWFRDVACVAEQAPDVVHAVDRLEQLREDAQDRDPHRLRAAVELVDDTRRRLSLNVSEELACETLAYRLERELAPAA
jgi:DNA polymerase III subunit delta'